MHRFAIWSLASFALPTQIKSHEQDFFGTNKENRHDSKGRQTAGAHPQGSKHQ
jgi:hypothetical protein